jgi:glycosyltransferase involved in cell wall biosynthesis
VARHWLKLGSSAGRSPTWAGYTKDALQLADVIDCRLEDLAVPQQHPERVGRNPAEWTANWYLPPFESPYYGGVMTILRFAAHMREQGVRQRILLCGHADTKKVGGQIVEAFPALADAEVSALDSVEAIANIPPADISFATLWTTAYVLLRVQNTGLKFYFMQDYEPLFYPAGSTYAQAELTYRFGFHGIANTQSIRDIYVGDYGGAAHAIAPCVDPSIFNSATQARTEPLRLFYYARPGTPRNGFELAACALRRLKARMASAVVIDCAGADWNPDAYGLRGVINSLGMLPYHETANLYRRCHVGLVMMMTKHPSYLPFELMACGALVVSNQNDANRWLLRHGENCLLAPASATAMAETLEDSLLQWHQYAPLRERAQAMVAASHSDWPRELKAAFGFVLELSFRR